MNRARDRETLEIVEAESLWGRSDFDRDAFVCASCDLQVFPASFEVQNLKRPYFSKPRSREHDPLCEVVAYERLVERARRMSVIGDDGELPVSYPDRLRPLGAAGRRPDSEGAAERPARPGAARLASPGHASRRRCYAAGSLHLVCRTYIDFPHDRSRLRLRIDGVDGGTYDAIFRHLERNRIVPHPRPRLFYAPMKFTAAPLFSASDARLYLACGENRQTPAERLYEVRLQWDRWSRTTRERVAAEIETTREEARGAWRSRTHADRQAWVFFLGAQSPADAAVFEVIEPRAICCLFAALTFPQRPRGTGSAQAAGHF